MMNRQLVSQFLGLVGQVGSASDLGQESTNIERAIVAAQHVEDDHDDVSGVGAGIRSWSSDFFERRGKTNAGATKFAPVLGSDHAWGKQRLSSSYCAIHPTGVVTNVVPRIADSQSRSKTLNRHAGRTNRNVEAAMASAEPTVMCASSYVWTDRSRTP